MKERFKSLGRKIIAFSGTPVFSCICMLGMFVCSIAIGRCIPGFNYEPDFPDELLHEVK